MSHAILLLMGLFLYIAIMANRGVISIDWAVHYFCHIKAENTSTNHRNTATQLHNFDVKLIRNSETEL